MSANNSPARHRQGTSVLAFLLLAACATPPTPYQASVPQEGPSLRIGTWNLEFLGAHGDFRNKLPLRDDGDFQKIGQKVRALGVAVLAVQEICGEAPLRKVAAAAGPSWQVLLGTSGGWDDGKTAQQIGFLYDAAVVDLLQAEELLALPREQEGVAIFHRVPVSACFRWKATGFDFRAITVHLKAGQKAPDETKRRLESTLLHEWIVDLQRATGEDQDIVVLGDFNSTYGTEPQRALERGGSLQYLQPAAPTPTIMHFPEPIDQVAVAPGFDELGRTSFTVHGGFDGMEKDAWRKIYSDHFPLTVTITAAADTDPAATFRAAAPAGVLPPSRRVGADPGVMAPARANQTTPGWWPPKIGSDLHVMYGPNGNSRVTGRLLQEVPSGPGGWLVVEVGGTPMAIPYCQVASLSPG